ncbi:MAG TPA: S49 family peptidase [Gemmataceae bacterium]|jgi:protease-4
MRRLTRFVVLGLWLASVSGCLRAIKVETEDRIAFNGPISAELIPNSNDRPVVAMPVEGGAAIGSKPHVAIVDVDGLLLNTNLTGPYSSGDNPVDLFREKLDAAAADPCTVALVVRINSPGGSVAATDMMWSELQCFRDKTRRPVVACLMDLGTGGAYYLATASDRIVAHPTTITGGIGVVLNLFNLDDIINALNITPQPIKAGAKIDLGTTTRALKPDEEALLQGLADEFHTRFRDVVRQQRPQLDTAPADTFDGRIFSAAQAAKRGLVDQVGYLRDALALARELANQPNAGAVILHRRNDAARTPFATTPNIPLQANLFPVSMPGLDRSKLPTFLYMWLPDPALERLSGK